MGYKFQFITLAGFHALNLSMFELARAYKVSGMSAYSRLQEKEFGSAEHYGYEAVKHQRFVGTGYFDMVTQVIASGNSSTTALAGSTEAEQFAPGKPQAETGSAGKSHSEEHASVPIVLPETDRTQVRM
jgi:isocitrate lyase